MSISQQQALDCFASDDLIGIGMEADSIRRQMHPEGVVSYAVSRAFVFPGNVTEGTAAEREAENFDLIGGAVAEGATAIRVSISANPVASLAAIERTFAAIRDRFPSLRIESLSAQEIVDLAAVSNLNTSEVLLRLREAGLDALAGYAGEAAPERWLSVHKLAHQAGLRSTAYLPFGGDMRPEGIVEHLLAIRNLQQETGGFLSFSLTGVASATARAEFEEPTAVEYLGALAIARMTLDNVENIESSSSQQGLKVAQMALRFGANDAGTIGAPSSDPRSRFTESDLRRVIRDAGFVPAERDGLYRTMFLNN